jgi:hypothetical protein
MAANVIKTFIAKALFKQKGAIANNKAVEFSSNALEQRLRNFGIDPNLIKNEQELNQILSFVKQAENQAFNQKFGDVLAGSKFDKPSEVLDMTGKKIDPRSKIMGGQQSDTEEEILARINKENKKGIENIREKNKNYKLNLFKNLDDKKKLNDNEYEEFLEEIGGENRLEAYEFDGTAGSAKKILKDDVEYEESMFKQYKAEKLNPEQPKSNKPITSIDKQINEEFKKGMKEGKFNNVRLKDGRSIKSEDDFREYIDELNEDNNFDFATGGRAGFKSGSYDRNSFEHKINELKSAYKRYKKGSSTGGRKGILTFEQFAPMFAAENFSTGGRAGFKKGSDMTRRTFMKILGGVMSIPILGKFLKPLKTAKGVSKVPVIMTDNVPGKPEWFDALVNKVILEGDDVTKKFATQERQIVHSKDLGDGTAVRVTQDMDQGAVRVEYQSEANVFGDDVLMQYKKSLPDEGAPNPAAQFDVAESGPVSRQVGPDDAELDIDEVGGSSIRDLDSDVSKLKEYATGKKPTMKEVVQNIERRKKAQNITEDPEAQMDAVIRRQGDYDPSGDEFASGGIARMLGE